LIHYDQGLGTNEFTLLEAEITEPRYKGHDCDGITPNPNIVYGVKVSSINYMGEGARSEALYLRVVPSDKPMLPTITGNSS
jgi:hypothetical protein